MKNILFVVTVISILLLACNKKNKTNNPTTTPNNNPPQIYYTFKIGNNIYSTNTLNGQDYEPGNGDTLLMINAGSAMDTISGGFTLKVTGVGTFTHDSTNNSPTNQIVVNFVDSLNNTISYLSKSGSLTLTKFDIVNRIYSGTFNGIMYLSSTPSNTLALSNGSFYLKN